MGQVDDHAQRQGALDQPTALLGQPVFVHPVSRAGHGVVKEVNQPQHPKTRLKEPLNISRIALKRLRAFQRQHGADDPLPALSRRQ